MKEDGKTSKNKKNLIKLRGKVTEVLPGTKFKVAVEINEEEHELIGYVSGKMRMHYIKLQRGDEVELEISPYDLGKGRITYRY
jgi:translation initiation factor IF-1